MFHPFITTTKPKPKISLPYLRMIAYTKSLYEILACQFDNGSQFEMQYKKMNDSFFNDESEMN